MSLLGLSKRPFFRCMQGMGFSERPNMRVILEDGTSFAKRAVQEAKDAKSKGVYDAATW